MMTQRPVDPGILLPPSDIDAETLQQRIVTKKRRISFYLFIIAWIFPPNPNTDWNMGPELKI